MKETGVLFTTPMVLAIDNGYKTQTRRVVKPEPFSGEYFQGEVGFDGFRLPRDGGHPKAKFSVEAVGGGAYLSDEFQCPYGQPGDRLWVRETFFAFGRWEHRHSEGKGRLEWHFVDMTIECDRAYQYAADNPKIPVARGRSTTPAWHKRPAIHMPRSACRTVLQVVSVRVERLCEISETDAVAEGIGLVTDHMKASAAYGMYHSRMPDGKMHYGDNAVDLYRQLWEQINGANSWTRNPWVWAVGFEPFGS